MMIYLLTDGTRIPVQETDRSYTESPHTGEQLQVVEGEMRTGDRAQYEALISAVEETGEDDEPLRAEDQDGAPVGKWSVEIPSHGSTTGDVTNEYFARIRMEEVEELTLDRLVIDGDLALEPYKYEENAYPPSHDAVEGPTITADVKVLIGEEEKDTRFQELLREGPRYVSVVREGISDEPVEMRIGPPRWSEHPEGKKYSFALMTRAYDAASGGPGLEFPDSRARARVAKLEGVVSGLISLLQEKGVVDQEEVDEVGRQADDDLWERVSQFRREEDIDDLG